MRSKFEEKLQEVEQLLLKMGATVEEVVDLSFQSLMERDVEKAKEAIEMDSIVDELEIKIESKCLFLLALQQPLARDLRTIAATMKIITDLERIGDLGANIAKVTLKIADQEFIKPLIDLPKMAEISQQIKPLIDLPKMAEISQQMIKDSLDAYVQGNVELAIEVAERDDMVDDLYRDIYSELLDKLSENREYKDQVVALLFVGRYLERIADHVTNVCEKTIFMLTGERMDFEK